MPIQITCNFCAKVFPTKPSRLGIKKFCSRNCKDDSQKQKYLGENNPFYGKRHSLSFIQEMKERMSKKVGELAPNWQGGINSIPGRRSWVKNKRNRHKRANGGSHSYKEWHELKEKYNFSCLACGRAEPEVCLTEDHIVPISKGGNDDISNIQPLCKRCNTSKLNKTIDYRNLLV